MTQQAPPPAPSFPGQPYPGQPYAGQPVGYPQGYGAGGPPPPRRSRAGKIIGVVVGGFFSLIAAIFVLVMIFGNPVVTADQVEEQIAQQYSLSPAEVSCPSSLEGSVGTQMTCTVTEDGTSQPLLVQVTSVDGSTVNFSMTPQ